MKSDWLGAFIAITAAILSNLGVNVQKRSHNKEGKRAVSNQRKYIHRPAWWVGMIMIVVGSLGDFFALGFASQNVVASLGGGSTILANIVFARFWLKQRLFFTDLCGVVLVTVGVIFLASASVAEKSYTVNELFELMQAPQFVVYTFLTSGFVMALMLRVKRSKAPALRSIPVDSPGTSSSCAETEPEMEADLTVESVEQNTKKKRLSSSADFNFPSPISIDIVDSSGSNSGNSSDELESGRSHTRRSLSMTKNGMEKQKSLPKNHIKNHMKREKLLVQKLVIDPKLPLYWAAMSGTIGAQSVLLAKCVMEMIFVSFGGENQFCYVGTYVLIAGMVATLLSQTHTLNLATMTGDTMSTFPVFQAFWICVSNINGIVFFQQAHLFTLFQWTTLPFAMAFVLMGITLIAKHEKYMSNNVKYSVAMPITLNSPRQHNIVAHSFQFIKLTPQEKAGITDEEDEEEDINDQASEENEENNCEFGLVDHHIESSNVKRRS